MTDKQNFESRERMDIDPNIFDDRRPIKSFKEGVQDNKLVVLGLVSMVAVFVRGFLYGLQGNEVKSSQFGMYRSIIGISTLGLFGIYAYGRELEWKKELARRKAARQKYLETNQPEQ